MLSPAIEGDVAGDEPPHQCSPATPSLMGMSARRTTPWAAPRRVRAALRVDPGEQ